MNSENLTGEIEVSGKSIFLIVRDPLGREQAFPVIDVPSSASECYKFGLWEEAIGDLTLDDQYEFSNIYEIKNQLRFLDEQIKLHFKQDCNCSETIDTQKLSNLSIVETSNGWQIQIAVYSNRARNIIKYPVVQTDLEEMFSICKSLLQDSLHDTLDKNSYLELGNVEYEINSLKLEIGVMVETWLSQFNRDDLQAHTEEILQIKDLLVKL